MINYDKKSEIDAGGWAGLMTLLLLGIYFIIVVIVLYFIGKYLGGL